MADQSLIEWCDATWNPIRGCSRVSQGCLRCYAERVAVRFNGPGQPYEGLTQVLNGHAVWNGQIRLVPEMLELPMRWRKPRRIFVNSMSDLFHENVPDEFIGRVFEVMARCPQHTFIVLTKRPERIARALGPRGCGFYAAEGNVPCPQPNVWLLASAEDQMTAQERIEHLVRAPAAIRGVSLEPLLGPVVLTRNLPSEAMLRWYRPMIGMLDWIIVGGESGPGARPMHPVWAQSLRDQALAHGKAFFFKQYGEWAPHSLDDEAPWPYGKGHYADWIVPVEGLSPPEFTPRWSYGSVRSAMTVLARIGKRRAGRRLDGRFHSQYPQACS